MWVTQSAWFFIRSANWLSRLAICCETFCSVVSTSAYASEAVPSQPESGRADFSWPASVVNCCDPVFREAPS